MSEKKKKVAVIIGKKRKPTVEKRKAPAEHAADTPVGTKGIGEDDFLYIVTQRANGTKYWRKTILLNAGPVKIKGDCTIAVGEVSSTIVLNPIGGVKIPVTSTFLKVLKGKPKYYLRPSAKNANAYIFGPMFSSGYHFMGYHGNDSAQTGILDLTGLTAKDLKELPKKLTRRRINGVYYNADYHNPKSYPNEELNRIFNHYKWLEIYADGKKYKPWQDRSLLKVVQKQISPRILFVGGTRGGDVGANIYVHLNDKKEVDGLIIDNQSFIY
jgi:hypothetical protein